MKALSDQTSADGAEMKRVYTLGPFSAAITASDIADWTLGAQLFRSEEHAFWAFEIAFGRVSLFVALKPTC